MSIFAFRRADGQTKARSKLVTLRETLKRLEAAHEETRQMAELKNILAARIAEIEQKKL
jgi:hypothetical protein